MYLLQRDPELGAERVADALSRLLAAHDLAPSVREPLEEALRRARVEVLLARRGAPGA